MGKRYQYSSSEMVKTRIGRLLNSSGYNIGSDGANGSASDSNSGSASGDAGPGAEATLTEKALHRRELCKHRFDLRKK